MATDLAKPPFVDLPGHGVCIFVNDPLPRLGKLCERLLSVVKDELQIDATELRIGIGKGWRPYTAALLEEYVTSPQVHAVSWMVGSPREVRLVGGFDLRMPASVVEEEGWRLWFACEANTWPVACFEETARAWMILAAKETVPSSGGAVGARTLLEAKNAVDRHAGVAQPTGSADALDLDRLQLDRWLCAARPLRRFVRRVYPLTLLGHRFASEANAEKLRACGAKVERVNRSLIVQAFPQLVSSWDAEYLCATAELRRIAWPITLQNPADAAGLPGAPRFEVPKLFSPPPGWPDRADIVAELARQMAALKKRMAERPVALGTGGELTVVD